MLILTILAQSPSPSPTGGASSGGFGFLFLILVGVVFWFLLIRPQQRVRKQHMETVRSIQVGDEIESAAGIFGTVRRMSDTELWVEIAPGLEIKMSRGAVRRKIIQPESME